MKAIVKQTAAPGAGYVDVDDPKPGPKDVVIAVKSAAICGTDIHIYDWTRYAQDRIKPPMIFGHEVCGDVVELGSQVDTLQKGDRVAVETHIPCGVCFQCQTGNQHICEKMAIVGVHTDGVFAEYAKIPAVCCWKLPGDFDPDLGAILEPIGVAVHGILEGEVNGMSVAVFGCGPIGLFGIGAINALGANKIFALEPNRARLEMARKFAPNAVLINPADENAVQIIKESTGGRGVDVVVELSGSPAAVKMAFQVLRLGGRVSLVGLPSQPITLDAPTDIIYKEAKVFGTTGRRMWDTWWQVQGLLDSGKFDPMPAVTHRMGLAEIGKGIDLAKTGQAGKVLLYP
ncbi:MAG: alcohol dehydrogenase catalytic domain-containing protein [Spirochaetales bacterium]|nr:alcohol dehydrogenase catalytic domain-containing protein [Spirochaetales bacterium]